MNENSEKGTSFFLHKNDKDPTSVWSHYLKSADNLAAKCKKCGVILKTFGGTTKGLHTHLSTKHNLKVTSADKNLPSSSQQLNDARTDEKPPTKRRITSYFASEKKKILDETLARMTALDGLTFNVFITSKDLRQLLITSGFENLPKSANSIKRIVVSYSLNIRQLISKEIYQYKALGTRFSLSFDEWTSTTNKRYININVHIPNMHWNLGLIRVYGSMNAEKCIDVLKTRLKEHNVNIDTDIVAIVTDGPNVMVRVGKIIEAEHQLCLVHGIHLAVCDVLYKKSSTPMSDTEAPLKETQNIVDETDDHEDEENIDEEMGLGFLPPTNDGIANMDLLTNEQNINELVKKARRVVVLFKGSPTKNDAVLQKYVKEEKGSELSLILDCKTRWNSLLSMLERFLALKTCIQKALIDLNHLVSLNESDFVVLSEIIEVFAPVKLAVDALCRRNANLCTADAVLIFLF
ncbi:uncharacterized protein LOC124812399 [Hydra vulgaris]|uniref:uncharacterized protein LOC124812399 n=1 Tax=Hydra vulgaris TaxID=6087 RepID=UPI0032EA08D5